MVQVGELLIASGHLTQEGLEEALDWQVLYGGRLGTNLLELKLVEEEQLAHALGKQKGCEVAWGADLALDPSVLSVIPRHIADRQELVPWKLEKRRLKLLCTELKLQVLDELSYKLGRPCTGVVAPEFRVFNLLRAHFGALRQMRALDFGVVPEEGRSERRKKKAKQETGGIEPAPELIDEAAFNDIYAQVLAGRGQGKKSPAPPAQDSVASPAQSWNRSQPPPGPPVLTPARGVAKLPSAPPAQRLTPPPSPRLRSSPPQATAAGSAPPPRAIEPAPPVAQAHSRTAVRVTTLSPRLKKELKPPLAPEVELRPEREAERRPEPQPQPERRPEPQAEPGAELLEELPDDAILEPLPEDLVEPAKAHEQPVAAAEPELPLAAIFWEEPAGPTLPARDESPLEFSAALQALEGVTDRDSIAHIVLRASRNKAARALLLQVQGGVALGWDGLGEGLENGAARAVAIPLSAPSAFQLVVNTRSHFMGPLQKTKVNIRFLAACGKKIPLSSLVLPILHRGRVSHLLYLDNGHKQQAPTDVGEMLILSQRIAQTVEALVERKRRALRG